MCLESDRLSKYPQSLFFGVIAFGKEFSHRIHYLESELYISSRKYCLLTKKTTSYQFSYFKVTKVLKSVHYSAKNYSLGLLGHRSIELIGTILY